MLILDKKPKNFLNSFVTRKIFYQKIIISAKLAKTFPTCKELHTASWKDLSVVHQTYYLNKYEPIANSDSKNSYPIYCGNGKKLLHKCLTMAKKTISQHLPTIILLLEILFFSKKTLPKQSKNKKKLLNSSALFSNAGEHCDDDDNVDQRIPKKAKLQYVQTDLLKSAENQSSLNNATPEATNKAIYELIQYNYTFRKKNPLTSVFDTEQTKVFFAPNIINLDNESLLKHQKNWFCS